MKLLRYGPPGAEKPALLDKDGTIRCLSAVVRDIDGFALSDAALKMIAGIDPNTLPKVDASVRLGACVARPVNYVCIGLNYADHAAEAGMPIPKEPIIFLKSLGALCGPNDNVKMPRGSKKLDWEVELGIVIGKTARYVPEHNSLRLRRRLLRLQRRVASANSSSSAPAPGTRARAATRSARPAPGW